MGILGSLENLGKSVVHGTEEAGKDVVSATSDAGRAIAGAATDTGDALASGVNTVGEGIEGGVKAAGGAVVSGADSVESGISSATGSLEHGAEQGFRNAVTASESAFEAVKSDVERILKDEEAKVAAAIAKSKVGAMAGDINALIQRFTELEVELANEVEAIRNAAMTRVLTPGAKQAIMVISNALADVIAPFHAQNMASFGVDFGASAAFGISGDASIGVLAGFPNVLDVRGYGSVGVTVGAGEGIEADVSLVFSTSAPADSGGPGLDVVIAGDFGIGGTVVVSFNLPDLSFGGISIGLAAGEEFDLSVGAGYTYVF